MKKEIIQIIHLDNRNFINSYRIFNGKNSPQDVFDYIAAGLIDENTFKIEIKRMKGEDVTRKRQNVTADLATTNKKKQLTSKSK